MPTRGFLIILVCVFSGVVLGFGVGLILGNVAPDFGIALFGGFSQDHSLPIRRMNGQQIGIGLGVANGVWIGMVVGIGLVIAEAIKSVKKPSA